MPNCSSCCCNFVSKVLQEVMSKSVVALWTWVSLEDRALGRNRLLAWSVSPSRLGCGPVLIALNGFVPSQAAFAADIAVSYLALPDPIVALRPSLIGPGPSGPCHDLKVQQEGEVSLLGLENDVLLLAWCPTSGAGSSSRAKQLEPLMYDLLSP